MEGKSSLIGELATQEIIYCTGKSGANLVVATDGRGQDSTSAVGHNAGATVEPGTLLRPIGMM